MIDSALFSTKNKISDCVPRAVLVAFTCVASAAHAQEKPADYPNRPIRIVVGIAPGGGLDMITRVGAQKLSERWNQSAIVDNRPGGGTLIGMDIVAHAPPDGYTLLGASELDTQRGIRRAPYDVRKVFTPIVQICSQSYHYGSHAIVASENGQGTDRLRAGQTRFTQLRLAGTGHDRAPCDGVPSKSMAGVDMVHVPYKGSAPAIIDIVSAQIHLMFASTISSTQHIKTGKLQDNRGVGRASHAGASGCAERVAEAGVPGFEWSNSYGLFAPAGTPHTIVKVINAVVKQGVNTPETIKYLVADGAEPAAAATPEEFKAKFASDYARYEKLMKTANIRIN